MTNLTISPPDADVRKPLDYCPELCWAFRHFDHCVHTDGTPAGMTTDQLVRELTYDEAIELAAKMYRGHRMIEMALTGDLGMTRITGPDRVPAALTAVELKAESSAIGKITRRGRDVWPGLVAA